MIIQNGTIQFKKKTATGIDPETGYPIKSSAAEVWGIKIPCQYLLNKYDNLGIVKGEHFNVAKYTILIEDDATLESEQIMLADMDGKEIGKFSIISQEPIEAVCEVKILV